jgi:hypothetical protein
MAATLVFAMSNDYTQWNRGQAGICTCISLWWAQRTLKKGAGINSNNELPRPEVMNIQMAKLRRLDAQPGEQTSLVDGLALNGLGDVAIGSVDDVPGLVYATPPHVAIFWTSTHTMGYRYAHDEKEFFDVEVGLFRAKLTKDILQKMRDITNPYGAVTGLRHLRLAT